VGGERGSGSILAVGLVAAILAVLSLLLPLAIVLSAKQSSAGAAADIAAGIHPGSPCPAAAHVSAANGATLDDCLVEGTTVTVRVVTVVLGFAVPARSTAGQPEQGAAR
jgi:secretion/DNA translocation related TadE-like protein